MWLATVFIFIFTKGSRGDRRVIGPLADGTSSVQAVDDSVALALLMCGIVPLGGDVVGTVTERPELVGGCL